MITVEAGQCMACGDIIYCRCLNDSRKCSCGFISIIQSPFGHNYIDNSYTIIKALEKLTLVLDVEDKIVLEKDFNNKENKYGYLKKGTWRSKF